MSRILQPLIVIVISSSTVAKDAEPDLPLCPTNIVYFPQNLPMHCRLPRNANFNSPQAQVLQGSAANFPTLPPTFFQSPPPDKQPQPIPFPVAPGFPAPAPGFIPPPGFPGPIFPPGLPVAPGIPGFPMPMGMPTPGHKLPVIVMPFYSPDPTYKKSVNGNGKNPDYEGDFNRDKPHKRKNKIHRKHKKREYSRGKPHKKDRSTSSESRDTDTSSSGDSDSDAGWWKRSRGSRRSNSNGRRHDKVSNAELLTPVIQYVTKDGYVIYEKEISKNEARDWLDMKKKAVEDDNKVSYTEIDDLNEKDEGEVNVAKKRVVEQVEVVTQGTPPKPLPRRSHRNPSKPRSPNTVRIKF